MVLIKAKHYSTWYDVLPDGSIILERDHEGYSNSEWFDVLSFNYWGMMLADVPHGYLSIRSSGQKIYLDGPMVVLIPPNSLIHWNSDKPISLHFRAFINQSNYPNTLPRQACCFKLPKCEWPTNCSEIIKLFTSPRELTVAEKKEDSNPISLKLKKFIDQNFSENFSMLSAAKNLGISQDVMIRYFKKTFTMTPVAYKNQMRLEHAMFTLLFSGQNVIDISNQVGFQNLKNFNKQFKKYTDLQPSSFKSLAKDHSV